MTTDAPPKIEQDAESIGEELRRSRRPRMQSVQFCGRSLFVRVMSGRVREAYENTASREANEKANTIRARLVVATLCDADGKRVFRDVDVDEVAEFDWDELDRVFDVARDLNGLSAKAREEIRGNS